MSFLRMCAVSAVCSKCSVEYRAAQVAASGTLRMTVLAEYFVFTRS